MSSVNTKPGIKIQVGEGLSTAVIGGIKVEVSADSNVVVLYATPRDAAGTYTFNEAAKYASRLDAHGHHDFHAPSKGELNVLWQNRNKGKLAGTSNETGSDPAGCYWSGSPYDGNGWAQRFSDGLQYNLLRSSGSSLRCVR